MAVGDITDIRIDTMTPGGSGLGSVGERRVMADFTAPGDLVRVRISDERGNAARGEVLELLESSPARVTPPCPLYGTCGGCNLQHIAYETQVSLKKAAVKEAFECLAGISPKNIRVRAGSSFEYRNRVQFHCDPGNRKRVGFMGKNGNNIVALDDCPIAVPEIRSALSGSSTYPLVPPPEKDRFTVYAKDGLFLSEGGKRRGKIRLGKNGLARDFVVDAGVFFQSNSAVLETLIEDLYCAAEPFFGTCALADMFCGVGTFAAFLAGHFLGAELVEENKTSLGLARENVTGSAVKFHAQKTDAWIRKTLFAKKERAFVVVDPPREGLSRETRRFLVERNVAALAYVSCNPATLGRDAGDFLGNGYSLRNLCVYDFYPQTNHIESLALFFREGTV